MTQRLNPTIRSVCLDDLISTRKSMMSDGMALPRGYNNIETGDEAEAAAYPKRKRHVRVFIVWDNSVDNFPLREVLEHMRETGAAMVQKVEAVT